VGLIGMLGLEARQETAASEEGAEQVPSRIADEQQGLAPSPHLRDGDAVAVPGDGGFQGGLAKAVQISRLALLQLAVLGHLHPLGYR